MWQLRHNVTTYDAAYVALAELLALPLLTSDARLAAAPGLRCQVILA
jgi:predicted nucleic acid-binding protein